MCGPLTESPADIAIRAACLSDAEEISALVFRVFDAFVAPAYGAEGRATFAAFSGAAAIALRLSSHSEGFVATAPADGPDGEPRILGYLEIQGNHITELFVAAEYQRRGLARRLLDRALAGRPGAEVTVNASPNAEAAYRRLGFRATGRRRVKDGVKFRPMARRP